MQAIKEICKVLDCAPGDIITVSKVLVIPATKKTRTLERPGMESRGTYSVGQQGGRAGPSCCAVIYSPRIHPDSLCLVDRGILTSTTLLPAGV